MITKSGLSLNPSVYAKVKVASHPKCDHCGGKIFYDSKIDLTPILVLKDS